MGSNDPFNKEHKVMRPRRIQNKAIVHPLLQNTHDYNEDTYNAIEDMRMSNVENKKINGL